MVDTVYDWLGFVFCEVAFKIMPDDLIERCIYRAVGESHEAIDGYVTVNYTDYRYYDQAFFVVGSLLYRVGCFFYTLEGEGGHVVALPKDDLT